MQRLAEAIDVFDHHGVYNNPLHLTLDEFMACKPNNKFKCKPRESTFIGQAFFAYQLLDTLLWAYGWPAYQDLERRDHNIYFEIPRRINSICKNLAQLGKIPKLQEPSSVHPSKPMRVEVIPSSSIGTNDVTIPHPETGLLRQALQNLQMVQRHEKAMDGSDIFALFHVVAFILILFLPVSDIVCLWTDADGCRLTTFVVRVVDTIR